MTTLAFAGCCIVVVYIEWDLIGYVSLLLLVDILLFAGFRPPSNPPTNPLVWWCVDPCSLIDDDRLVDRRLLDFLVDLLMFRSDSRCASGVVDRIVRL